MKLLLHCGAGIFKSGGYVPETGLALVHQGEICGSEVGSV